SGYVDRAGPLESPVDQTEATIGREYKDNAVFHFDAVEGGQENRLVLGLIDTVTVAQRQIHVVEENDASALHAEQPPHRAFRITSAPRLPISIRRDNAILPVAPIAFFP